MQTRRAKQVVVVAYDRLCTFEFGVAVEAFGLPRPEFADWYDFAVTTCDQGAVRAAGGFQLLTRYKGLSLLKKADIIIIPGWRDVDEIPPQSLLKALQAAAKRGTRIVSFCSGVFVLAAAGLLSGRSATTHWKYAAKLQQDYPSIQVKPDILYTEDKGIFTSAGSAAAIDLCLHIIRKDYGAKIGNAIARRLVVSPHREGGQKQFIDTPMGEEDSPWFAGLLSWTREHIRENITVGCMARRLNMSPRNFARKFQAAVGDSPGRWIVSVRVATAKDLLETTSLSLEEVASRCGLGDAALLRHHFTRQLGTTPSAYRQAFNANAVCDRFRE